MPDQGSGTLHGVQLFEQRDTIRTTLGVCPQLDVLFDDLTVREHLEIFYNFKDPLNNFLIKKQDLLKYDMNIEIEYYLEKMMLKDQENTMAQNLPGGSKRRLSVAIAIIGGSKLILLDEPSSGMDIEGRFQLWELIQDLKKDRIIILTTHFMEEAE